MSPWLYTAIVMYLAPLLAFWTLDPGFYGWYMYWGKETGIFVRYASSLKEARPSSSSDRVTLKIELTAPETVRLDPGQRLEISDLRFKFEGKKLTFEQLSTRLHEICEFTRSEDSTALMRVKDFNAKTRVLKPSELWWYGVVLVIPRTIAASLPYQELISICDMLKQENVYPIVIVEIG